MGRPKKETAAPGAKYQDEVAQMSADEMATALETIRETICAKAKAISQVKAEKKDAMGGFNEVLKSLGEEQEEWLARKGVLEDALKRSAA